MQLKTGCHTHTVFFNTAFCRKIIPKRNNVHESYIEPKGMFGRRVSEGRAYFNLLT